MPVNYEKVVEIVRLKQVVCESTLEMQKITSSFGIAQWLMDEIGNETQEVLMSPIVKLSETNKKVIYVTL